MRGVIATGAASIPTALVEKARAIPQMEGADLVKDVTCADAYDFEPSLADTVARSELRRAAAAPRQAAAARRRLRLRHQDQHPAPPRRARLRGARVPGVDAGRRRCWPWKPDGIFLSNGPGDPAAVTYAIDNVSELVDSRRADRSASASATSCSGLALGAQDLQAEVRPPRRQSSGQAARVRRRSRSPRRTTASPSIPTRCRPTSRSRT